MQARPRFIKAAIGAIVAFSLGSLQEVPAAASFDSWWGRDLQLSVVGYPLSTSTFFSYIEPDGDTVTVRFSRPILDSERTVQKVFFLQGSQDEGYLLKEIVLSDLGLKFRNLDIHITVQAADGGDAQAQVEKIDARGIDLRDIEIEGHLGALLVGDANLRTPALRSLTVSSLGFVGNLNPPNGEEESEDSPEVNYAALVSEIGGGIRRLNVQGDINGARLNVSGPIGVLQIGGNLQGGAADFSGSISAKAIQRIYLGGSMLGGEGAFSGAIFTGGNILTAIVEGEIEGGTGDASGILSAKSLGGMVLGGSLSGGEGRRSGNISAGQLGRVVFNRSVLGGTGEFSGRVESIGKFRQLVLADNLQGGVGEYSGTITAKGNWGIVDISGDLIGDDGKGSGAIFGEKRINKLGIKGHLFGGSGRASGHVEAIQQLSHIVVGGNLVGGDGSLSGSIVCLKKPFGKITHSGGNFAGAGEYSGKFLERLSQKPGMVATTGGTLVIAGGGSQ